MSRTERPWLEVYEKGRVEPETRIFEDSLYELFSRAVEEHREHQGRDDRGGGVALEAFGCVHGLPGSSGENGASVMSGSKLEGSWR
jgi:hypothetical protein